VASGEETHSLLATNHSPIKDPFKYDLWKSTNVFPQKQPGYFAVYVRVANGNISSVTSRSLIGKLKDVIADDVRVTINQGLQFVL
jgi:sulfite reductase (ferredoxin)